MTIERDSNAIFADLITAPEEQQFRYEKELIGELRKHAYAVTILTLNQPRKDIVEDAISKALTHARSFRGESKFSTWFQKIVMNSCRDAQNYELRKRDRGEMSIEDTEEQEFESGQDVEAQTHAKIDLEKLTEEGFDEIERQVLHLKMNGLSEAEIAKELTLLQGREFTKQRVDRIFSRIRRKVVDKISGNVGE